MVRTELCRCARYSANKGLPLPLGRGVCETKSENGRPRQRGIETMVTDHGLGRGQTMVWGVDPETVRGKNGVVQIRRRTNVQQLTCNIDLSCSFYCVFFSFVLIGLNPFVLTGESPGGKNLKKMRKSVKKCEKF